ncbi:hypothetical protein SISNIDRAFT_488809 [Sistotremastrum niveocremeum HHB9708]|uniref:RNase III domain-containing protein n=1 Tax=Sistotremastrum niveocremeum HHB9708 TaxID=1314777 RepID=A0A164QTG9_9AGAM|nr:hypothetical protein SISNIDRAFT_488809 [Sistotremastrum niveocremeum HHB9708]
MGWKQKFQKNKDPIPQEKSNCLETLLIKELGALDGLPGLKDLPEKLRDLVFHCHETEERSWAELRLAGNLTEDEVAAIVGNYSKESPSSVSNKLLEFDGDLVVEFVVRRWCESVTKNPADQANMASLFTRNVFMAHLAFHMGLLENPHLCFKPKDAVAVWIWKRTPESRAQPPPKVIANLFEALMGAMRLRHGTRAVYDWFEPLLRALHPNATNPHFANATTQEPPYVKSNWKNGKDKEAVSFMRSFAVKNSDSIEHAGASLRKVLNTTSFMSFVGKNTLDAPHSRKLSSGEAFLKLQIFCAFMRSRYYLYFHKDGERIPNYLTNLIKLILSPAVLSAFATELRLHDFFLSEKSRCEPDEWEMCQAMICACGHFEQNNNKRLSSLEPLFEMIVLAANIVVGWKDFIGHYSDIRPVFPSTPFQYGVVPV